MAFVAHERVLGVELVPCEVDVAGVERVVNQPAAVDGHVRVLPAEDHQQFAFDFFEPVERVVVHSLAKRALVNVRRIETSGRRNIGLHGASR